MRIGIFTDTYPPFINGVSTSVAMLERALKNSASSIWFLSEKSSSVYEVKPDVIFKGLYGGSKYTSVELSAKSTTSW